MNPSLSVVLPVYNRVGLLPHPLDSLRAATAAAPSVQWELIVIDDGSTEDLTAALSPYRDLPLVRHRLATNSGLLQARLAGLAHAQGEAVFFLDADDAVAPGKFTEQLPALAGADVVHGDMARQAIDASGRPAGELRTDRPAEAVTDPVEFYLIRQPAPHDPIFRRSYLQAAIDPPLCPAVRSYDSIAETWFYYHLALQPARIAYRAGAFSIVGEPAGERLSRKWERQCAGAIALMEAFLRYTPDSDDTAAFRRKIGRCAFNTWRGLPRDFAPAERLLDIWRRCPRSDQATLGGSHFRRLARCLGPETAGRIFRRLRNPPYASSRTVSPEEYSALFP